MTKNNKENKNKKVSKPFTGRYTEKEFTNIVKGCKFVDVKNFNVSFDSYEDEKTGDIIETSVFEGNMKIYKTKRHRKPIEVPPPGDDDKKPTDLSNEIKFIKDTLGIILSDMKEMKQDINYLKEKVTVLETDMVEVKSDIKILKEKVTVLENDVSILKKDVSEHSKILQDHSKILQDLQFN
ncbi:conserved hypothetical protein [Malacoplasma penetrans HF-2]|uniref:DUF16 domain-containing protein n=1 Tax=Malacoplasma penetrans (strain HF-2) TaxID=272633 RepID=Q8EV17_MALP2|nr:hypothetical protein [Malacoplasma penetrans]BAC44544.1 conserved hypothetical protein [Malacoplasma penetrans HF-2]